MPIREHNKQRAEPQRLILGPRYSRSCHPDRHKLLRNHRNGVLGTLSKTENGAPFGSVAPYALGCNRCAR